MKEIKKRTLQYSVIQCMYWMMYAILSGNASVYLTSQGLDESGIGTVLAVSGICSALLQPRAAALAQRDRRNGLHRVLLMMLGLLLAASVALLLLYGGTAAPTAVAWCIGMVMLMATQPLVNTLAVLSDVPFSAPRAVGSIGYAILFFALGQLVPHTGTILLPICIAGVGAVLFAGVAVYPRPDLPQNVSLDANNPQTDKGFFLKRYPELGLVVMGAVGLYFSHMAINTFAFQIVQAKGGAQPEMGVAGAVAAILELPVMFGFVRLTRRFSARRLMRITGIFFALKCLCTLLCPDIPTYYLTQVLQMPAFALATVASVQYIRETIPTRDAVKGQSWYSMAVTVGSVLGSQVGGLMINVAGINSMLMVATAVAAAGSVVIFFALRPKGA